MNIKNMYGENWTLTDFGAFGPYKDNEEYRYVYLFTKAEAKRVIKKIGYVPNFAYTIMRRGLLVPDIDRTYTVAAVIRARSITLGCQSFSDQNARDLRRWALSK